MSPTGSLAGLLHVHRAGGGHEMGGRWGIKDHRTGALPFVPPDVTWYFVPGPIMRSSNWLLPPSLLGCNQLLPIKPHLTFFFFFSNKMKWVFVAWNQSAFWRAYRQLTGDSHCALGACQVLLDSEPFTDGRSSWSKYGTMWFFPITSPSYTLLDSSFLLDTDIWEKTVFPTMRPQPLLI